MIDAWLHHSLEWKDILTISKHDTVSVAMQKKKKLITKHKLQPIQSVRKRRRTETNHFKLYVPKKAFVGPTEVKNQIPKDISECTQCIINAMSQILPLDVYVNLFGYAHKMILVGVLYKHNNLCWIILNRANFKLYIASHFVTDALHLFIKNRKQLGFSSDQKFNRQGINETISMSLSLENRAQKQIFKLNMLSKNVLKFNSTRHCFDDVLEFLRCVGSTGKFLIDYKRTQPLPPGFQYLNQTLCETTGGWKVFKKVDATLKCQDGCTCHLIIIPKQESLSDSVTSLIEHVPSSLETPKKKHELLNHYELFIEYLKKNPNLVFFPHNDVVIP